MVIAALRAGSLLLSFLSPWCLSTESDQLDATRIYLSWVTHSPTVSVILVGSGIQNTPSSPGLPKGMLLPWFHPTLTKSESTTGHDIQETSSKLPNASPPAVAWLSSRPEGGGPRERDFAFVPLRSTPDRRPSSNEKWGKHQLTIV